jgi:hypothetical protein
LFMFWKKRILGFKWIHVSWCVTYAWFKSMAMYPFFGKKLQETCVQNKTTSCSWFEK